MANGMGAVHLLPLILQLAWFVRAVLIMELDRGHLLESIRIILALSPVRILSGKPWI